MGGGRVRGVGGRVGETDGAGGEEEGEDSLKKRRKMTDPE